MNKKPTSQLIVKQLKLKLLSKENCSCSGVLGFRQVSMSAKVNRMCIDIYLQVLQNLDSYFSQKYLFIKIIQHQIEIRYPTRSTVWVFADFLQRRAGRPFRASPSRGLFVSLEASSSPVRKWSGHKGSSRELDALWLGCIQSWDPSWKKIPVVSERLMGHCGFSK